MAKVEVEIQDNSKVILDELERKMPEILRGMGNELYKSIYNTMTEDKVVDTGRLRGSISYSTPYANYKQPSLANDGNDFIQDAKEKDSVVYGSNVHYASFVELGTSKQRARNFLRNGTYRAVPQIKQVVEEILKQ